MMALPPVTITIDGDTTLREAIQSISHYEDLIQHMQDCGWSVHDESGLIYNGDKSFVSWQEAIMACIEVAS
jgi:oligoribonuclease (3'-5' exoribonuclease)